MRRIGYGRGLVVVGLLGAACSTPSTAPAPSPTARAGQALTAGSEWSVLAELPTRTAFGAATLLLDGTVLMAGGTTPRGPTDASWLIDPDTGGISAGPPLAEVRTRHAAVLLRDGRVLVVGGEGKSSPVLALEWFDPATGAFAAGPALPEGRVDPTATLLVDGRVLITGSGRGVTTTHLFDPTTNTLAAGPAVQETPARTATRLLDGSVLLVGVDGLTDRFVPGGLGDRVDVMPSAPMQQGHPHASALTAQGDVLVVGGCPCSCVGGVGCFSNADTHAFDPTTSAWTTSTQSSFMAQDLSLTLLPSGELLMLGGVPAALQAVIDTAPATPTFWAGPPRSVARAGHGVIVLPSGGVLLVGGAGGATFTEPVELMTPRGGRSAALAWTGLGRIDAVATPLLTGGVLVSGGNLTEYGDQPTAALELVDAAGSPPTTGTLLHARYGHRATLLPDGGVLITGGFASGAEVAEAERVTGTTATAAGSLITPRSGHAAVALASGDVLVAGGMSGVSHLSSIERWNAQTQAFEALGELSQPRGEADGALLEDGRVLFVGANGADLWDPASGRVAPGPSLNTPGATLALLPGGRALVSGTASVGSLIAAGMDAALVTNAYGGTSTQPAATLPGKGHALLPGGALLVSGGLADTGLGLYATADQRLLLAAGDEGKGSASFTGPAFGGKGRHALALLGSGQVLQLGGHTSTYAPPDGAAERFSPPGFDARPTLDTAPAALVAGATATVTGAGFAGRLNAVDPSADRPLVIFRPWSGQGAVRLPVTSFTDDTLTARVPASGFVGPGWLHVAVGGAVSSGYPTALTAAALGVDCTADNACASGSCADGVCCDAPCDGVCDSCLGKYTGATTGTCGLKAPGADPGDACVVGQGGRCTGPDDCTTGLCTDGVCCDQACDGQCEACDVEGSFGVCVPVGGAPRNGRAACAGATGGDACAARVCDGTARTGCEGYVGVEVECRAATCADGVATFAAACDGSGACPAARTEQCDPYVCAGDACGVAPCSADAQCAAAFRCAIAAGATVGDCVPRAEIECVDEQTAREPGGAERDCSPYRCVVGGCLDRCSASDECVAGSVCDTERGACVVVRAAAASGDSGGCSAAPRGARGTRALALLGMALAAGGARRRRRAAAR